MAPGTADSILGLVWHETCIHSLTSGANLHSYVRELTSGSLCAGATLRLGLMHSKLIMYVQISPLCGKSTATARTQLHFSSLTGILLGNYLHLNLIPT